MKKILMLIGLVLFTISGVFAQVSVAGQTYYYKYVETVEPDTGVRRKHESDYIYTDNLRESFYLTFTQNSCYVSDDKGIKKPINGRFTFPGGGGTGTWTQDGPYIYQREQNNLLVFMCKSSNVFNSFGTTTYTSFQSYLYFSKDLKKINSRVYAEGTKKWGDIDVFERVDPPQQGGGSQVPEAPTQLW
jgi:hypothetical protein